MRKQVLLEEGRITPSAKDLVTGSLVNVLDVDFERKIVSIRDDEGHIEFRFFSEIRCIGMVDDCESSEKIKLESLRVIKYEELKQGLKVFDQRYQIWRTVHKTWILRDDQMVQFRSDENESYACTQVYNNKRFYIKEQGNEGN